MVWLVLAVIGGALTTWSFYHSYRTRKKETKLLEATRPLAENAYNLLTQDIQKRHPLISFNFLDRDEAINEMYQISRPLKKELHQIIEKTLMPIIQRAIQDFTTFDSNLISRNTTNGLNVRIGMGEENLYMREIADVVKDVECLFQSLLAIFITCREDQRVEAIPFRI